LPLLPSFLHFLSFDPENAGRMFLWNVRAVILNCMVLHIRRYLHGLCLLPCFLLVSCLNYS
jgi:hypothetical protein